MVPTYTCYRDSIRPTCLLEYFTEQPIMFILSFIFEQTSSSSFSVFENIASARRHVKSWWSRSRRIIFWSAPTKLHRAHPVPISETFETLVDGEKDRHGDSVWSTACSFALEMVTRQGKEEYRSLGRSLWIKVGIGCCVLHLEDGTKKEVNVHFDGTPRMRPCTVLGRHAQVHWSGLSQSWCKLRLFFREHRSWSAVFFHSSTFGGLVGSCSTAAVSCLGMTRRLKRLKRREFYVPTATDRECHKLTKNRALLLGFDMP